MNALADKLGFLVLYPEQSRSANLHRCWNWHQPENQRRGSGEPAAIAALTLQTVAVCRANLARVYIAGISAGGTTAIVTAAAYPEIYAAVGMHSAVASGKVDTIGSALSAMRKGGVGATTSEAAAPPAIIFHGDGDTTVHPENATGIMRTLKAAQPASVIQQVHHGRSDGGREYTCTRYRSAEGAVVLEHWTVHGGRHAWSGGSRQGSYTDPAGPDASVAMVRFFLAHRLMPDTSKAK